MIFTTADGTGLFYEIEGEGEPLVLLNGIMMTTRSWALQLPALRPRYRCILHDFRGQLRSADVPSGWTMEQHADDLAALLDHLGIDGVDVVGTSYGGEVGMIFAYLYPERVRSLVVIAATSRADESMRSRAVAAMNAAVSERDQLYDIVARDFFSPEFVREHPEVIEQGRARLLTYGDEFFRGYASLCDAFSALDITDNLRGIRCRTLVIAAERDKLKPVACSVTIAGNIAGAQFLVVPEAGHAVVIEKPEAISEAVGTFLQKPKPKHSGVHLPPPAIDVVIFLLAALIHRVKPLVLARNGSLMVAGVILIAAAAALAIWSIRTFWRVGTSIVPIKASTALVTTGPFRFSRNPIYVALAVAYTGGALILNSWWPIILLPVVITLVNQLVIVREERYLEQVFGLPYTEYRGKVRRWL